MSVCVCAGENRKEEERNRIGHGCPTRGRRELQESSEREWANGEKREDRLTNQRKRKEERRKGEKRRIEVEKRVGDP